MALQDTDRILDIALTLVAEEGWRALSLPQVAHHAEIGVRDLKRVFPSKRHLLVGIADRFDRVAADAIDPETANPSLPAPERLFDALMSRFELLQEDRAAHLALLNAARTAPSMLMVGGPRLLAAMRELLRRIDLLAPGPFGCFQAKILAGLYLSVIKVWAEDESEDLGRTMAALDKRLGQLDELVSSIAIRRRKTAKTAN